MGRTIVGANMLIMLNGEPVYSRQAGLTVVSFTNTALEGYTGAFPKDVFQAVYAALDD